MGKHQPKTGLLVNIRIAIYFKNRSALKCVSPKTSSKIPFITGSSDVPSVGKTGADHLAHIAHEDLNN